MFCSIHFYTDLFVRVHAGFYGAILNDNINNNNDETKLVVNSTDRNDFVGLREHGDEHVDEYDHHGSAVAAEHEFSDELRHFVSLLDSEDVDRRETVHGEVQCLNDLKQAAHEHTHRHTDICL